MDSDKICELLDEINLYFYGCYRNARGGTSACEKFHDYICAVSEAKKLIALLKEQDAEIRQLKFADMPTMQSAT